jgi:hypothetical protein
MTRSVVEQEWKVEKREARDCGEVTMWSSSSKTRMLQRFISFEKGQKGTGEPFGMQ